MVAFSSTPKQTPECQQIDEDEACIELLNVAIFLDLCVALEGIFAVAGDWLPSWYVILRWENTKQKPSVGERCQRLAPTSLQQKCLDTEICSQMVTIGATSLFPALPVSHTVRGQRNTPVRSLSLDCHTTHHALRFHASFCPCSS